jgi:Niemann-Pick C1 protein
MSKGGIPVMPFYMLGGFIPPGAVGFPENPDYTKSTAVVMTILVDNYDVYSEDPAVKKKLAQAKEWELTFINFMKEWEKNESNTIYFDLAYSSERSIEDELARQSEADVVTIAISYLIMLVYITIALGKITSFKRFMVIFFPQLNAECVSNITFLFT